METHGTLLTFWLFLVGYRGKIPFPETPQLTGDLVPNHALRFSGSMAKLPHEMVLRRTKVAGVTVHGFRSAFRDWCGEATSFPRELAEAALAHVAGDATERAYRRGDALEKRRKLMEAWANFCEPRADSNVVHLAREKGCRYTAVDLTAG
jgi:integrase